MFFVQEINHSEYKDYVSEIDKALIEYFTFFLLTRHFIKYTDLRSWELF